MWRSTAPSACRPGRAVRLEPRPFRARRDGFVAARFVLVRRRLRGRRRSSGATPPPCSARCTRRWPSSSGSRRSAARGRSAPTSLASRRWAHVAHAPRRRRARPSTSTPASPASICRSAGPGQRRVVVPLDDWRAGRAPSTGSREFLARRRRRPAPASTTRRLATLSAPPPPPESPPARRTSGLSVQIRLGRRRPRPSAARRGGRPPRSA